MADDFESRFSQPQTLSILLNAAVVVVRELRLAAAPLVARLHTRRRPRVPYETLWLELALDIADPHGEQAVLTRRQCVRFLAVDGTIIRELVWGEGEQLVRYTAQGARRIGVRSEGSRRAVLLDPGYRPVPGDRLTITSRRTIRGGFRHADEYCEALLERPTGRLDFTVRFARTRPPRSATLVVAETETVVRRLRVRYGADGRALLRCRVRRPADSAYSLRWRW